MYLRYRNTVDGDWTVRFFSGLANKKLNSPTRIQRVSLRQQQVDHITGRRRKWNVKIGANELAGYSNTGVAFLSEFWCALERAFTNAGTSLTVPEEGDYIRVSTPDGDEPLSWLNENPLLPNYEMELTEKDGRLI